MSDYVYVPRAESGSRLLDRRRQVASALLNPIFIEFQKAIRRLGIIEGLPEPVTLIERGRPWNEGIRIKPI
jgi:hypothetical protein